jgi:Carboxypeptidase regulatory-like domain
MKQLVILIVAAGSLLAHAQTGAQPIAGEIKGTVTDPNGIPVSGATVYAVPQGLTLNDITPRTVKTDGSGRFDFRGGFPLETYKLYSRKEGDSYPDPFDRFYAKSKDEAPAVDLTPAHPSATVTVKLADKAATIVGRVIDADTGAILKATVFFLDENGRGHHVDSAPADGTFRTLLPPGKDLSLMVMDRAMEHLVSIRLPAPLRLEPGQYVYMDIPVSRQ